MVTLSGDSVAGLVAHATPKSTDESNRVYWRDGTA
jgi:hypothetical protein